MSIKDRILSWFWPIDPWVVQLAVSLTANRQNYQVLAILGEEASDAELAFSVVPIRGIYKGRDLEIRYIDGDLTISDMYNVDLSSNLNWREHGLLVEALQYYAERHCMSLFLIDRFNEWRREKEQQRNKEVEDVE